MNKIENNTISLSNEILNFTSVGIMERRILYVALSLINPISESFYSDYISRSNIEDFDFRYSSIIFSIDDFMSFWGLNSKNGKMEVERKAENLIEVKCNFRPLSDLDGERTVQVFDCVEESDYGFIKLRFHHQFLPYLYNVDQHSKGYTTIPLRYLTKLKSDSSFYFMRLCLNEVSLQKRPELTFKRRVDTLCGLLGINDSVVFRDFNARYLKSALKEINSTGLVDVSVELVKRRCKETSRPKVYKIEFNVKADDFHQSKSNNQDAKSFYEGGRKLAFSFYNDQYDEDKIPF